MTTAKAPALSKLNANIIDVPVKTNSIKEQPLKKEKQIMDSEMELIRL
jgi:hypothetical protein